MAKTQKQAIAYANSQIGRWIDFDGWYAYQCFDSANDYWYYLFGHGLEGGSAVDIPTNTKNKEYFKTEAKVYHNTPSFLAKGGDVVVFPDTFGEGHGHVAVVLSATLNTITVVEQNWDGNGWDGVKAQGGTGTEPATKRTHYYDPNMIFIRPKFAKSKITAKVTKTVKETAKKVTNVTKSSNKMRILLVAGHGKGYMSNDSGAVGNGTNERDFIRKNIVPNVAKYLKEAGHTVSYYGGSSMNQDLYQDTAYGYNIGDTSKYGMYWVKKQKYDAIVEFHLDAASPAASGGHVIIGKGLAADKIDKGIQSAIVKHVGQIRPIDPRDNLLNVNVAKQLNLNYRLVELGFITSKKDMDKIKKDLQAYTKDIAQAISGGTIVPKENKPTPKPQSKPKPTAKPSNKPSANNGIKIGSLPPTTLKNQKDFYFKAKVKDGLTVCEYRNGEYKLTNMEYTKGHKDFRVFEIKNGWCRIYSSTSNLWVWRERLTIYELGKTSSKPKPKTSWKWEGIFTCNIKSIKVRRTLDLDSKSNIVDSGSWIYNKQYIRFVELYKVIRKSDGKKHWVGKFKYESNPSAGYFYAALGEVTDKQEKFEKEKKLYGTAKVTKKK
ncbi:N-acetylmuramoyl-L-alanine amidase [Mammaliicoccus sciuri]|uniref:N-acetylmuramoyl-L-alanine amidase n=1 Tax=Mammaliicoccus sciuri TaxID=1296 RepID=UPI0019D3EA4C|nr:N-acetylmuramoyl-L-alanine amidase [Mammaliicoccus sciuri]QSN68387.1 N-acetylmuramoyl-L-alanine amidase [Mammaliicoccus sciuri]UIU23125.1 N-acetylmuramoyl-L-alanine amidase [Mammaliicoccus sciuri]UIU26030.1 N-acetylmuramoyl-L-alanine amidase [Mammaliicoccus sciuri]